jgi:hypothetical protein
MQSGDLTILFVERASPADTQLPYQRIGKNFLWKSLVMSAKLQRYGTHSLA